MTQFIKSLRAEKNEISRQANQLLNEKGARSWSPSDQAKFDNYTNALERIESQIGALIDSDMTEAASAAYVAGRPMSKHAKLFDRWLRKGDGSLNASDWKEIRAALSTTTPSEGGYTVPTEVARAWVDRIKGFGAIRRLASHVVSESSGHFSIPTTDGVDEEGEMAPENFSSSDQDASFGTASLLAHRFSSKVITVSMELAQDSSFDITDFVSQRLSNRIGRLQNRKFTVGTGAGEPTGLVTAAAVAKTGVAGQTTTVIYDDLVDVVESIDAGYEDEGPLSWQFNQDMRKLIRKLKDNDGRPLWTPSMDAGRLIGTPDLLLGYPVVINNHMPAPAANAKTISFGQHKRYMVHDRLAVTYYRMTDSRYALKGQIGFMAFARAGGNLVDTAAVKTYRHPAA